MQNLLLDNASFLNWYDYGARFYDAQLGRFHTQDRFAEKYFSFSPYQYGANNPVLFIDVNGDSINVAKKYREQFNKALESIFGDKASNFSYNKSGNLVYSGTKKDFKGKTRKAFKKLSKVIGEETTTNVIYESSYTVNLNNGSTKLLDAAAHGGGVTLTVFDANGLSSENYLGTFSK